MSLDPSQALFFGSSPLPPILSEDPIENTVAENFAKHENRHPINIAVEKLAEEDLSNRLGPAELEIRDGKISIAHQGQPITVTSLDALEALRCVHEGNILRLRDDFKGTNLGSQFELRLHAMQSALSRSFDRNSGLLLGVQSQGLIKMMPIIAEAINDLQANDLEIFLIDMLDLANQFESYRRFVSEPGPRKLETREEIEALSEVTTTLENLSDDEIDPEARLIITAFRAQYELDPTALSESALVRVIGNAFRAYARFLTERAKGIGENATKTFDKLSGGTLGAVAAAIIVIGPALYLLSLSLPSEFSFLLHLAQTAKLMIP